MQKNAKSSLKDVIVVGFAMFAIFFGAGNLIFPPYLGMVSGQEWFKGFLCFMIADAGLAVMTVLAMIRYDGTVWSMLRRLHRPAAAVLATIAMLCVGPLLCIPRTCAPPITPFIKGDSPNDSMTRPQRGSRTTSTIGEHATQTPIEAASLAAIPAHSSISSGSNEQPIASGIG